MRITHVYVDLALRLGDSVELSGQAQHHIAVVLRAKIGQQLMLFNGDGFNYLAEISDIGKKKLSLIIQQTTINTNESPLAIHLGQCLSQPNRFDLAVQKATEMGVTEITPILSEHAQTYNKQQLAKKQEHWQHVAISAAEQSHRAKVPLIHAPQSLCDWLQTLQVEQKWVCAIGPKHNTRARPEQARSVAILTGPEGGLSAAELRLAETKGFEAINLGGRVLRTETAPIAAISLAQYFWGDVPC